MYDNSFHGYRVVALLPVHSVDGPFVDAGLALLCLSMFYLLVIVWFDKDVRFSVDERLNRPLQPLHILLKSLYFLSPLQWCQEIMREKKDSG